MKELLDNLRKALLETAGRAATALGNMPPADQMAGMQEVVAANSTLTWIKNDLENVLGRMAVATIDDEIKKLSDGAVAAALADGSLVKKVDADAAVIAAEGRVRQEEADKVAAEKTRLGVIAARRTGDEKDENGGGQPPAAMHGDLHETGRGLRGKRETGQPT